MLIRSALLGFLSAVILAALYLVWQYPVFLDTGRTFGPDGTPWLEFVPRAVLYVLGTAGIIGAAVGGGFGWVGNRRRSALLLRQSKMPEREGNDERRADWQ